MTPWHYRWLCQFAYINLPGDSQARQGQTLSAISRELMTLDDRGQLACGRLREGDREALKVVCGTKELGSLRLMEFVNRNGSSGLAAYAFRAEDGKVYCVFRGSESRGCGVPNGIDWLDNFLAPFRGSVQYEEIRALAGRLKGAEIVFSGHSKGAHNALYALAVSGGARDSAVAFNGQGFAPGQLDDGQRARLSKRGVNYVTQGDIVGSLLWHPEKRVFVRRQGTEDAHSLGSMYFDEEGEPEPAARPIWSLAVEWGTRRYLKEFLRRRGGAGGASDAVNMEMM